MATRARARVRPPPALFGRDDLVRLLIDRLLHDPGIQAGKLPPKRGGQLIGMAEMEKSVPGPPFPFPGQPFVISNQPTQLGDVISLDVDRNSPGSRANCSARSKLISPAANVRPHREPPPDREAVQHMSGPSDETHPPEPQSNPRSTDSHR